MYYKGSIIFSTGNTFLLLETYKNPAMGSLDLVLILLGLVNAHSPKIGIRIILDMIMAAKITTCKKLEN